MNKKYDEWQSKVEANRDKYFKYAYDGWPGKLFIKAAFDEITRLALVKSRARGSRAAALDAEYGQAFRALSKEWFDS